MVPGDDPHLLRRRAAALRQLAAAVDRSAVHDLGPVAGEDTWRGPAAEAFRAEWRRAVAALHDAAADLRRAARALDQQAAAGVPVAR